ncbi:hypothetical protein [Prosthecobacter vanneervenii]|uniref:Arylsulfotransferase (ASST) n=1 Tax=Prosthecobacter vanneervenii TaxID=48466 RepID=A0A7W7YAI2_9BACT|nr:hypothetical protein [Prosthecobacter vanneervenii]MBB5032647.1 hypothetical protein [Prosthecobacter vanneervenii]
MPCSSSMQAAVTAAAVVALLLTMMFAAAPLAEGQESESKESQAAAPVAAGRVLIASGEGICVFDRGGAMEFGRFFVPVKNGRGGETAYGDIVYDGWRLPTGNYLCSAHRWVREVAPDGRIIWEHAVKAPAELKTCVPLPDGGALTTDAGTRELVRLTPQGGVAERVALPPPATEAAAKAGPHARYNLLRRTAAGTYLLALRAEKAFVEVDGAGRELWRHAVPDLPVVAERLANGHTLMAWRGGLLEVTPEHAVVWELRPEDIREFPVVIFGGFHRFENGNTLVANSDWHYHDAKETAVQLFEVTREKKVVWRLGVEAFAGKKPGSLEPKTGNIEQRIVGLQWLGQEKP